MKREVDQGRTLWSWRFKDKEWKEGKEKGVEQDPRYQYLNCVGSSAEDIIRAAEWEYGRS